MRQEKNILNLFEIGNPRKDLIYLCVLYTLSFGLLLFNQGIFWDDWILYGVDQKSILNTFREAGGPWAGYYHNFLLSFEHSIFLYRAISFFAYLASGIFVYKILLNIKEVTPEARLFIVAIFLIFPVNSARIALIDSPYAVCYFSFFAGFWILSSGINKASTVLKVLSLPFFLVSFLTQSFLVYFFATVALYIFYIESKREKSGFYNFVKIYILKNWYLLISPFVFFIIKNILWRPYGQYAGYNSVSVGGIIRSFTLLPEVISKSFCEPIGVPFNLFFVLSVLFVCSGFLIVYKNSNYSLAALSLWRKQSFRMILLGFVLFFGGVFAYLAAGLMPELGEWNSRHQLLASLGAAFMIYYFLDIVARYGGQYLPAIRAILIASIISLLTMKNIHYYIDFQRDYYAQMSLMNSFKNNALFRDNNTFIFDNKLNIWANDRTFRFYEFSGMFREVFGDQAKIGLTVQAQKNLDEYINKYSSAEYNLKDYNPLAKSVYGVELVDGDSFELFKQDSFIIRMIILGYIDKTKEAEYISRFIKVNFSKK